MRRPHSLAQRVREAGHTGTVTPPHSLNRPALVVALALAVSQDILYALIFLSFMNHYLLDVLDASPGLPGYTLALYGGTRLIVHPIGGRLLDRMGGRMVYSASLAVQLLAMIGLAFYQSLALFLGATVLLAIGAGLIWPLTYALVSATQPSSQLGRIGGMLAVAGYASTGVGFAVGIILAQLGGGRSAFIAAVVIIAVPALSIAGRTLGGGNVHAEHQASAPRPGFSGALLIFAIILFLDFAALSALAGIYGPYARRTLGLTLLQTTAVLLPAGAAAAVALAVISRQSRPSRRFLEMALLYALAAAGALALSLTSVPAAASAVAVVLGLGVGGVSALIAAMMLDAGSGKGRGVVIGALMSAEGLGGVVGPATVALVTDLQGPRAGFAVIAAVFAILAPLCLLAFRHGRPERAAAIPA